MTKTNRKNGTNTGRTAAGKFGPGNSGKPKGARHHTTRAVETLMNGEAEAITRTMIEAAVGGDIQAAKFILERVGPAPRKDGPVMLDLPGITTAADAAQAMARIVESVATGEMTPAEGNAVSGLIEGFRKTLETEELARRMESLEAAIQERLETRS